MLNLVDAAKRAGVSRRTIERRIEKGDLRTQPVGAKQMVNAADIDKLYNVTSAPAPIEGCQIYAVVNQKGGVGKTTTAVNLASALASKGYRVLAIDCDAQANMTAAFGSDPDKLTVTLYNVLIDDVPIDRAIVNPVLNYPTLSLVGSSIDLASADQELQQKIGRDTVLRTAVHPHRGLYDFIFLDCPPHLGSITINALAVATQVIVPVDMSVFSLTGVSRLLDTIAVVRKTVNPSLGTVRAVANKVDSTTLASEVLDELSSTFGDKLYKTLIRKSVKIGEAQARATPITVDSPSSPVAAAYFNLAAEVLSHAVNT